MTRPAERITELLARWDSGEGKPYKGSLIDWSAYEADPENMGCMCAQGQVLALVAGWEPARLRDGNQYVADGEVAKLLNISRAHAVLLRIINDRVDGAPSIVLTDPSKVLGDKWSKLLDFWWMFHCYEADDWKKVVAARASASAAAYAAAAASAAAARDAASASAYTASAYAAVAASAASAGDAAWEIQGFELLGERGRDVFFLPMFGIKTLDDIPARPDDYGLGIVPQVAQ